MVSFDVTPEESEIIANIAQRAVDLLEADFVDTSMDITATHANGNKLRLEDLLNADDFNFAHDINGIARHLNRQTGELTKGFLPRYSAPDKE